MPAIDQAKSFGDAGFSQALLYLRRDVDQLPALRNTKPQFFSI